MSTIVVLGAGLGSRGTSCKRHEMSSIKNGCGEGWVERGFYLPEEGEVRVRANRASCNPSRLGLGWGLYLWRRVVCWPCGKAY